MFRAARLMHIAGALALLLIVWRTPATAAEPLPKLGADEKRVSVSGLSSGAYMAGQFQVAYSKLVIGAAVAAACIAVERLVDGFEIEAVLRPEDAGDTGPYRFLGELVLPNIAEARDDRFVAALDLYERRPEKVAYMVRAVTPGSFTMPGVVAEDMYRPDTFARTGSRTIEVARR